MEADTDGKIFRTSLEEEERAEDEELIPSICGIAISESAAHERRCSDIIRTVKILDQLTSSLNREVYELKRSAVYLQQPKAGHHEKGSLMLKLDQ